ncbi:MAG: hypothetical protein NTX50_05850 [Candidatus Sumerlaeota bacterium]|nr:hypothetical protein [Candidatus Sumerlaeota bacterium]
MNLVEELIKHLRNITGVDTMVRSLPAKDLAPLPVYLTRSYDFREIQLFGQDILLAIRRAAGAPELSQLTRDREALTMALGREIAFVLPSLMSYERRRLVEKRVAFIVPGRQVFLPMMLVDLRERFRPAAPEGDYSIGWVAQAILLRHLQIGDVSGRPLSDVASLLGYSAMAVTQAAEQLEAAELVRKTAKGRAKIMEFGAAPGEIWKRALPRLRSPIKRRYLVAQLDTKQPHPLQAGVTALAQSAGIAADSKPVWAMSEKQIRKLLAQGDMSLCPLEEDMIGVMEGWAYNPSIIAKGPAVDALSLYLTLKDDPDERVQQALERLMEPWT